MTNQGFKSVSDWTVFCSALCVSKLALLCMSFSLMPKDYCLVFTFSSFSSVFVFDVSCARLIATSCFILESFLCVGLPVFVFFPHVLWLFSPHLLVSPLSSYSCVLVGSPASFLPTLIVSFFFFFLLLVYSVQKSTKPIFFLFGILIPSSWTCVLSLNFGWTSHTRCLGLMTQACPLHEPQRFDAVKSHIKRGKHAHMTYEVRARSSVTFIHRWVRTVKAT